MQALRPVAAASAHPMLQNLKILNPKASCRAAYLADARPPRLNRQQRQCRRAFVSNPLGKQSLVASRILHYPARTIYDVISDVSSYSSYVPFCTESVVTKYSNPASDGRKYPEEAKLKIGFKDNVSEEFWSRVYCSPEKIVEAVSGSTETSLSHSIL